MIERMGNPQFQYQPRSDRFVEGISNVIFSITLIEAANQISTSWCSRGVPLIGFALSTVLTNLTTEMSQQRVAKLLTSQLLMFPARCPRVIQVWRMHLILHQSFASTFRTLANEECTSFFVVRLLPPLGQLALLLPTFEILLSSSNNTLSFSAS
ncbi:hypothetical protein L1887_03952 [Cichorium endivia]|nr:hypothetical protein L1887_03952 [Cichorium endivia]